MNDRYKAIKHRGKLRLAIFVCLFPVFVLNAVRIHHHAMDQSMSAFLPSSLYHGNKPAVELYPSRLKQSQSISKVQRNMTQTLYYYSHTRGDRPGSAILDMLMAHAYVFLQNATTTDNSISLYGGACGDTPFVTLPNQQKLIRTLGLETELPFACPSQRNELSSANRLILEYSDYDSMVSQTFRGAWLEHIRSKSRWDTRQEQERHGRPCQIVVHVRRGDVTLCGSKSRRYFPNQYYIHLIQQHLPQNGKTCNVSIFSNLQDPKAHNAHEPREPWQDFSSRGYNVFLGTDLAATWESMITADVLILSKSSFSHVPAMFNTIGKIVYTPYWTLPLPDWHVVSDHTRSLARKVMRQTRKEYCANFSPTP